ncbi:LacI family DNA-binding transcriptional regulator [Streptomyces johnsoniae]|uniref:LacI family DNA-binding transcriptional regulator n=1 Tax=Streptomyces johnsoniae TaxID=3075532 RepID=A0ABU2S8G9_9ACTN|nr:LacI family DNA-binding transcriptional regulator [Streptomyces sp. DSM 41886]MDT0444709.1 LacI family DNA-binding transcriptional regulator [Streptomyces sp. DSM 41886]
MGSGPAAGPRRASTRSVTLRDVAARAGVSSQTVSRVLRIPDEVAPHTRERVEAAIRESGYVPNLAARNLASNRSKIVATVIPALGSELFSETLTGLSAVLSPEGYQLLLGYTDYDDEREEDLIRSLLGRRPDGICLTGTVHRRSTVAMLRTAGVPVVETWDWTDSPVDTLVGFSNERAMHAMVSSLHESGYREPCFVGSLLAGDHRSLRRLAGFRRAVDAFRPGREPRVVDASEYPLTLESGARLLDAARRAHPAADVLVFSTDVLACGALLAAGSAGVRVPEDVAVTGFGDFELSRVVRPGLTTVSLPNARIGREAAALLLQRMRGESPAVPALDLGFEIRRRQST